MFTSLINLFFPAVCAGCDSFLLSSEIVICTHCRHNLPLTNHHLTLENDAYQKFYGRPPVEFVATMCYFHKKGIVQEMIHKLKYSGNEDVGKAIGDWYSDDLNKCGKLKDINVIVPVPLHPRKLRERGYNQITQFGKSLSHNLGVEYNDQILLRNVYSKTQTKKTLLGRSLANESIFAIVSNSENENKHFLLIDDVLTTGATLEACGRALMQIPGAKLSIVCMAMSHS